MAAPGLDEDGEGVDGLGRWEPLRVDELVAALDGWDEPWWLMGGVALDRFVGRPTRAHVDLDVEIPRPALGSLLSHLNDWDPHTAHDGVLTSLRAATDQPAAATGVWWRRASDRPWAFDLQLATIDADPSDPSGAVWRYRRHPAVQRPLMSVWWTDGDGLRVVAPELQLLFKARSPRPKDELDAQVVVPLLDTSARHWLVDAVRAAHPESPWLAWL